MAGDTWRAAWNATTLPDACLVLLRLMPDRETPCARFRDFYRESAKVYERMAKIDPQHRYEALAWVRRDKDRAEVYAKLAAEDENRLHH